MNATNGINSGARPRGAASVGNLAGEVTRTIDRYALLHPGQAVLVAVSGGVDSMVLLGLLDQLASGNRWRLTVAHFNHRLRGAASDADEALVVRTAQRLGRRCLTGRADTRRHAELRQVSLEMAARELRHQFLARAARRIGADTVALAHHADDQVELFFLRLFRGAGGTGLAGMKWSGPSPADAGIRLVRPLLDQSKAALLAFAAAQGIAYREDASNRRRGILRNRLRVELLPLLTRRYAPTLGKAVLRAMAVLGEEADFAAEAARRWLAGRRAVPFAKLHVAVQRQCLRQQLAILGASEDFELIERLRRCPDTPVMIEPGVTVVREPVGKVLRAAVARLTFHSEEQMVDLADAGGEVRFKPLEIRWRIGAWSGSGRRLDRSRAGYERFDADKVGSPVRLRHWRRGDRFQPIGMTDTVKLQDLFTNQKTPRAERRTRVVATTQTGELFWVEGLRIGERFKLDIRTRRCLKWKWRRC
ncbi:MAG: tRNA lysidine(34) synthetase TilS [Verrucomicrobia bacterium]|nr:tRNA lysidine(34) synthetase TilS [Verrucomicrobiota bacterium]